VEKHGVAEGLTFGIPWRYHVSENVITGAIMVRTQIQLSEEQAKAIKRIAAAQGTSMAEVIRRAVNGVIIFSPAGDWNERHQRAIEIVGKFRSGKRDVSKNHDRYLTEAYRG
jgi:hypothetical protein